MISLAALAVLNPVATTVELARGAPISLSDGTTSYQSVLDTYIEAAQPETNKGGEPSLLGGPGRTVLIKFGDLARVVPAGTRVVSAELVLTSVGGEVAELAQAARVRGAWGEGSWNSLAAALKRRAAAADPKAAKDAPVRGGATWRQRKAGEASWREPGAKGAEDAVKIAGAKLETRDDKVVLTGIGEAVQAMVDRPYDNHGFALDFLKAVEFASSNATMGRPRLVLQIEPVVTTAVTRPDLSVTKITRTPLNPSDGQEVTYTATVKNVGSAPAKGFSAVWAVNEREGATIDGGKALAPGEEVTLSTKKTFKLDKADHRFQPIALRITPTDAELNARNDALEVLENAKWVELTLARTAVNSFTSELNPRGSRAIEDWVQSQVSALNEVYFDRSRFSFAPEGALERVVVGTINLVGSGSVRGKADGTIQMVFDGSSERAFLAGLAGATGLTDLQSTRVDRAENEVVGRTTSDWHAGLMGYGDTRFEGLVPGMTVLPYEPRFDPIFAVNPLEPTGLLSATDVMILNGRLEGTVAPGALPTMPKTVIVRAQDVAGRPQPNLELSFFQTAGGRLTGAPAFTVVTSSTGSAILPARDGESPFGKLDANGGNHTFLVRAVKNGVTEWAWLKAWQAIDAASRGSNSAAIIDLRFDIPGAPLETGTNLAKERILTDSAGSLPAKLAALTDEDPKSAATLSGKPGDWVEIDLGRDRTVGEVALAAEPGRFWRAFDVYTYATGQKPEETVPWAREVDFGWTAAHRGDGGTVHYRGAPRRFRFVRIVNRSGGEGILAEVRVIPATVAGTP